MPGPVYYPGAKNALNLLEKMLISTEEHPETPVNKKSRDWLLDKHNVWENSITGIAMGYYVEAEKGLKHLKKKNFAGTFAEKIDGKTIKKNRGDITTTTNKYSKDKKHQGKVIQLKHTICDKPSSVNEAIKDAFTQLSGKKGEIPLDDDILIAEIFIANPNNAWPFDRTDKTKGSTWIAHNHTFLISQFVRKVISRITTHLLLAEFEKNHAAAKKKINLELQNKRPLTDLYNSDETLHAADSFDADVDTSATQPSLELSKLLFKVDQSFQKTNSTAPTSKILIEEPSPVSKDYQFIGHEELFDSPTLILKLNFTTGRKILFEKQQEPKMVNKIVLSVRRIKSGKLSVKFVREKPVSQPTQVSTSD